MSEAHKSEMITQWIVKAEHDLKILKDEMSTENPEKKQRKLLRL